MVNDAHGKKLKVGQVNIHYFMSGYGEPLIVLHGGAEGARAWLKNVAELSKHYCVYVPDLPGFGRSQPMSDEFHLLEYVEFVENFANTLGIKSFHLMGHSIGGGIALHYALRFPEKIKKLVIVSSICLGTEIAPWARFVSLSIFYKIFWKVALSVLSFVRWMVRLFYARFEFMNPVPWVKMSIGKNIMTSKGQTTVLLDQLSELSVPTLLVWGAKDEILPVRHAYTASRLIPNCQLHVFEDCSHSVYKQKVQEFSQLLIEFLG